MVFAQGGILNLENEGFKLFPENIIADYVLRYIMKCGNMAKISIPIDILQVVSQYLSMVNFFVRT